MRIPIYLYRITYKLRNVIRELLLCKCKMMSDSHSNDYHVLCGYCRNRLSYEAIVETDASLPLTIIYEKVCA